MRGEEKLVRVACKLFELAAVFGPITPAKALELAGRVRHGVRKRNGFFAEQLVHELRGRIRWAVDRGYFVSIIVDLPERESLEGTPLQRTLLKIAKRIRNLAAYEGAEYVEVRASGRQCPACDSWGIEVESRKYRCDECGIQWNRDWGSTVREAIAYLRIKRKALEKYRKEWRR